MKKITSKIGESHPKYSQHAINDQTQGILKVWQANREFRMKDTTFEDFEKAGAALAGLLKKMAARDRELAELRRERAKLTAKLHQLNTRARSGMRGYFGMHSAEFAQIKTGRPRDGKSAPPPTAATPAK